MPLRYKPVKNARLFTRTLRYDQIDWNNWNEVALRFRQQLHWWYVGPLQHMRRNARHSGFAVTALCCVLIDTLSQYEEGAEHSTGRTFKKFVRNRLSHLCAPFPAPIRIWNEQRNREEQAVDFADVLWSGYRCGILHEAHPPLYGRLWGVAGVWNYRPSGFATYADNAADAPTIELNPGALTDEVVQVFNAFFRELRQPAHAALRANVAVKFRVSYGIEIGHEP